MAGNPDSSSTTTITHQEHTNDPLECTDVELLAQVVDHASNFEGDVMQMFDLLTILFASMIIMLWKFHHNRYNYQLKFQI